jgi:sugar lactone lactonase YvrE
MNNRSGSIDLLNFHSPSLSKKKHEHASAMMQPPVSIRTLLDTSKQYQHIWLSYEMCVDSKGRIYGCDTNQNTIRIIERGIEKSQSPPECTPSTFAANSAVMTYSSDFSLSQPDLLAFKPMGICVDRFDTLYITDRGGHCVWTVSEQSSGQRQRLAGSKSGRAGHRDAPHGDDVLFNVPWGICVDRRVHNLYIAERLTSTIRRLDPRTGAVSTLCGSPNRLGLVDGIGTESQFRRPIGVTLDRSDTWLFVADVDNGAVRRVHIATAAVSTVCSTRIHFTPWISSVRALACDATNRLFLCDSGAHCIRALHIGNAAAISDGRFDVVCGNPERKSGSDGTGDAASMVEPIGMAIDRSGNLIVYDDDRIRQVSGLGVRFSHPALSAAKRMLRLGRLLLLTAQCGERRLTDRLRCVAISVLMQFGMPGLNTRAVLWVCEFAEERSTLMTTATRDNRLQFEDSLLDHYVAEEEISRV